MNNEIILVNPNTQSHRTAEETLALGYLGSVLRGNGNNVVIIDVWLRKLQYQEMVDLIVNKYKPSGICITCYLSNILEVNLFIKLIMINLCNVFIIG